MNDPRLHFKKPLLTSPFHARTSALNKLNAWGPWGGYTTVLAYDDEPDGIYRHPQPGQRL